MAKRLTLSKSLSNTLFRSDVDPIALKKIKSGTKIAGRGHQGLYSRINPLFREVSYSLTSSFDDVYILSDAKNRGPDAHTAFRENATEPAVANLLLDVHVDYQYRTHLNVAGTGRPIFGGGKFSVTVRDVMLALANFCELYSDGE